MEEDELESALKAVVDDMGKAALKFKGKRYAPKPKLGEVEEKEAPEEKTQENPAPSAEELESLLTGG